MMDSITWEADAAQGQPAFSDNVINKKTRNKNPKNPQNLRFNVYHTNK